MSFEVVVVPVHRCFVRVCACVRVRGCIAGDDSETCGELAQSASLVYSSVSS